MKPEIFFDLPRAEYDALPGDNWSRIKLIGKSPAHYLHGVENDGDDTDARKFGRAAHLALLEPDEFARSVVTWTGGRRAGKEWERFCEENAGCEILTESEAERLAGIVAAATSEPFVQPLLTGGRSEVTVVADIEAMPGFPVRCKGRLDYLTAGAIVDVKMTRDASPAGFGRQAWTMGYLGQAAFYLDLYAAATGEHLPVYFVPAEHQAPYCVAAYRVTDEQLAAGRSEYQRLLCTLAKCRIDKKWPGYVTGPVPLELPRWAAKQAEEDFNAEQGAA